MKSTLGQTNEQLTIKVEKLEHELELSQDTVARLTKINERKETVRRRCDPNDYTG